MKTLCAGNALRSTNDHPWAGGISLWLLLLSRTLAGAERFCRPPPTDIPSLFSNLNPDYVALGLAAQSTLMHIHVYFADSN